MKKIFWLLLFLVGGLLLGNSVLKAQGKPGLTFYQPNYQVNQEASDFLLIGHAGGSLQDGNQYRTVTNAKEAFEQSYQQGIRFLEVDLVFTSDKQIIARHDWQGYLYQNFLGQTDVYQNDQPLSYDEVMEKPIYDNYQTMDFSELLAFLDRHQDANIIIDMKPNTTENLQAMYQKMIDEAVKAQKTDSLKRIIPQIYSTDQYALVQSRPFKKIIFTLYATQESDEDLIAFFQQKPEIYGVTMSEQAIKERGQLVAYLQKKKVKIFVNTIDSVENLAIYHGKGFAGIYTNHIRETKKAWLNVENQATKGK